MIDTTADGLRINLGTCSLVTIFTLLGNKRTDGLFIKFIFLMLYVLVSYMCLHSTYYIFLKILVSYMYIIHNII